MAARDEGKRGARGEGGEDARRDAGADPRPPDGARDGDDSPEDREEVAIAAVDLVTALARLDLEAALAYDAAAGLCDDGELADRLREFAKDHRVHLEALNEALEAEGEPAVAAPETPVLAGLVQVTGPLGDEVIVVTLLGNEQLTNLSYDAALSYEWDQDTEAMLRRFQQDEERHIAWLAQKHDALGGHAEHPDAPSS
jgi:rubrerythrin